MRYGHRGANQPVVDLKTRRVWITSQNHGLVAADPEHGMLAAHPSGATSPEGENLHGYDVGHDTSMQTTKRSKVSMFWSALLYRAIPP